MNHTSKIKQHRPRHSEAPPRTGATRRSAREPRTPLDALREYDERYRSEERFRALIEKSTDGIALLGATGTLLYASPSTERLFGYSNEDLIGRNASEFIHSDDLETASTELSKLFEIPDKVVTVQYRAPRKNGTWRWVEITARNLLAEPSVRAIVLNYRDITERVEAEQAQQRAEEKYRTIFEHAVEGIFQSTPAGRFLSANPALAHMWGYASPEELIASVTDIAHQTYADPGRRAEFKRLMDEQGEVHGFEFQVRRKDGSVMWVSENARAVRDGAGTLLYYEGTTEDITPRKQAEQELERRAVEFAALYETTRDLSAQQDLPTLLNTLVERATTLLNATSGFIYLFDPKRRDLELVIERGFVTPLGTRLEFGEGMAGRVAQTLQPLIVDNYRDWEHRSPKYEETPIRAIVEVPIVFGGELIGVLGIQEIENATRKFTDADARLLTLFASQAASAIYNARLFAETKHRADEFTALHDTTRDLAQAQDLSALLKMIVERAIRLLAASGGGMYIYDAARGDLEVRVATHSSTPIGTRLQLGEGMAGRVAQTRRPLIVDDYRTWPHRSSKYAGTSLTAVIEVPMLYAGELVGVLAVEEEKETTRRFTEEDARLLFLFASQAASAVYNTQLLAETRHRADEFAALYDITHDLAMQQDVPTLLRTIVERAATLLSAPGGGIYLYDAERSDLTMIAPKGADTIAGLHLRLGEGLAGRVAQAQQPIIIDDYSKWEHRSPQYESIPITAVVQVPMLYGGDLIGVLAVHELESTARRFTESDARLLSLFAGQAASAVYNVRMLAETQQHVDELAALYDTTLDLTTQNDLSTLIPTIVDRATTLLHAPGAFVYLFDPAQRNLELRMVKGVSVPIGTRLQLGEGMAGRVAQSHQPLIIDDYHTWEDRAKKYDGSPFSAVVEVPMLYGGELIGVLAVNEIGATTRKFTEADARLLSLFAAQAASAFHNVHLFEETRQRAQRQEALYRISTSLAESRGMQQLCEIVIHACHDLLGYSFLGIFLLEPRTGDRVLQAQSGWDNAPEDWRLHPGEGVSELALLTGQLHYCADVSREPRYIQGLHDSRSEVDVPIKIGDSILGVLVVEDPRIDAFDQGDLDMLQAVANQLAVALENTRLFEETRQRLAEMETVNKISTALRAAQTLEEMLPLLIAETVSMLNVASATVWLHDPSQDKLYQAAERGFPHIESPLAPSEGIAGRVFTTGETYLSPEFKTDPLTEESKRAQVPAGLGGACVPIRAADQIIGAFFVSVQTPRQLTVTELHLLTTIAEIAGNAIHRTRLHEQTEQQLQRLDALHTIDKTITSSLDVRVTLGVILTQITSQLHADAASVLLLNPHTKMLEFAAGHGFRTRAVERFTLHLGESLPGRVALERRIISLSNLTAYQNKLSRAALFAGEGFVVYYGVPLIAKGQVKGVLEIFNRTPLVTETHWLPFLKTLAEQAAIAIDSIGLFQDLQRSNLELSLAYDTTLEGWSRALDLRDRETEGHAQRVVEFTLRLAREMRISESELVHVRRGVLLHDIGKMGISDSILLKPGPLTPEEMSIMRKHPEYAFELLAPIQYLQRALDIPYCHHEKWDGTGYPRGLKGEEIPLAARVFAVVDVWDALISNRPYRAAWHEEQVRALIRESSGSHFDPKVVEAFFRIIDNGWMNQDRRTPS